MTRGELTAELAGILGLRHEARFIVEEVLGSSPLRSGDDVVPDGDVIAIRALAARRRAGEPLQYIFGHWAFRTLDLLVDARVLIPRPETEQVVEVALGELEALGVPNPTVVDAGTGSGAIVLSLAAEVADRYPAAQLWAIDTSPDALVVAGENVERVREQHGDKVLPVRFVQGSWLHALPVHLRAAIHMIIANPPYVAEDEWPDLPGDVRQEPFGALVAAAGSEGTPGLADVEQLLDQALQWLTRPGVIVIEMAPHQTAAGSAFGPIDGIRRRPRGAGPGAATAGPRGESAMSAPQLVTVRQLDQLVDALAQGSPVALPGDGGYHLAVRYDDAREPTKARTHDASSDEDFTELMVGERKQAAALSEPWSNDTTHLTDRMWPGPLTIIVPRRAGAPSSLDGKGSVIYLTMPAWRPLRLLCRQSGSLAVTMLRHADGSPLVSAGEVQAQLADVDHGVRFVLEGGPRSGPRATVVDCTVSPPRVQRVGAVPESYVEAALLMSARKRTWFARRSNGRSAR